MYKLIILVIFLSLNSFSKETEFLKISRPKIYGIKKAKFFNAQTVKLAQKILWINQKYQPVIAAKSIKASIKNLNLSIVKKKGINSLRFTITGPEGQLISESWANGIEDRFLLLQIRLSLYEVFYGKQTIKKVITNLQSTKTPSEASKASKELTSLTKMEEDDLLNNIRALVKSAGISSSVSMKPFSILSSLEDSISYEDSVNLLNENLKKKKKKSKRADEFQVDLKKMRMAIRLALKSDKIKRDKSKKKDKEKSQKQDKEGKDSTDSSSSFVKNSQKEENQPNTYNKATRERRIRKIFDFVYFNKNSESNFLVEAKNNFNFLGFRYTYRKNLSMTRGDDLVYSLHYLKSVGSKAQTFKVPNLINAYIQYLYAPLWLPVDLFGGLHYENQPFINLPKLNEGLKVGENKVVWAQFGAERVFVLLKRRVILNFSFFKTVLASSSYPIEEMSGTKLLTEVKVDITKKYRIGLGGFKEEITGSKYTLNQNTFILSFDYVN